RGGRGPRNPGLLFAPGGRREVEALDEAAGVLGAVVPVHARVGPVDRQRPLVAHLVQGADQRLPVDAAVPRGAVVPATPRVAGRQITVQQPRAAVEGDGGVAGVDVVDAVGEAADEGGRV